MDLDHRSRTIGWLRAELARIESNPHNLSPTALASSIAHAKWYLALFEKSAEEDDDCDRGER